MIKLVCFLRRRPGMTAADFHRHWLEEHGPLIAGTPSLARHLVRYEQNHPLDPEGRGERGFDGVTVQWMESMESFRAFVAEPAYAAKIAPDEARFLDRSSLALLFTDVEDVKKDGGAEAAAAPVKLLALLRRKPGLEPAEFHRHWATQHAKIVLDTPEFEGRMLAYHQNHRLEDDYRRDAGGAPAWDGVAEIWMRSPDAFAAMAGSTAYRDVIAPDEELFIDRASMTFVLARTPDVVIG